MKSHQFSRRSTVDEYIGDYKLIKETVGEEKYVSLELAKHKETGQVVAIEIINKAILTPDEKIIVENEVTLFIIYTVKLFVSKRTASDDFFDHFSVFCT